MTLMMTFKMGRSRQNVNMPNEIPDMTFYSMTIVNVSLTLYEIFAKIGRAHV